MAVRQKGLTLIELLVAVGILGIVGGIITVILFTTLQGASKSDILREVKQNGDYALTVMERLVRNASGITSTCDGSTQTSLTITNPDGKTTQFSLSGTQIASTSALATGFLTSNKVAVVNPPGLAFVCSRTAAKPDLVKISFSLSQAGAVVRAEEKAQVDFQTTVSLRTY